MGISGISSATSGYPASTLRPAGSVRTPGATGASDASEPAAQPQEKKPGELSKAEQAQVRDLQKRDREVRQHEQAHLAASGGLATSGATYTYKVGPDGISYAVGGEVNINVAPGRTPQETIARAQTIRAAALAPADPSGQDRAVAAEAQKMESEARAELAAQQVEQTRQQFEPDAGQRKTAASQYQQIAGIAESVPKAIDVFA